jgi:hypothetical protein
MNLILFGAGASHGSASHFVPPMGANLFLELKRFNPLGWGALPPDVAIDFELDFERGMSKLATYRSHDMPILQRAMAAYFFNFLPTSDSLYIQLANRIKRSNWSGAIATLNYERLLEISLLHVGIKPVTGSRQLSGQIELCMPHGCCHLFSEGVLASPTGVSFSGVGVTFDGTVIAISDPIQFNARINNNSVPPVMSYFEPEKTTSSGVSFIRSQRARWLSLVGEAKTIVIVGVRVRPSDSHIWNAIAKANAKVVYCSGPTAAPEYDEWALRERPGKLNKILNGFFAKEFNEICNEVGL